MQGRRLGTGDATGDLGMCSYNVCLATRIYLYNTSGQPSKGHC